MGIHHSPPLKLNSNKTRIETKSCLISLAPCFSLKLNSNKTRIETHNINHTNEVVKAAELIGKKSDFSEAEMEILLISAWFHDIGYILDYNHHEDAGKKIAREFLSFKNIENSIIEKVEACLEATKMPQNPKNKVEEVLCDADMFHLSQDNLIEKSLLFWKESNIYGQEKIKETEYLKSTLQFIDSHNYFTEFGKTVLSEGKKQNIKLIRKKRKKKKRQTTGNNCKAR